MRVADAVLQYLEKYGVEYIFGISAGTVSSLFDASNDTNIKIIMTKNEAGTGYSATKYADNSNKLGVCMVAGAVGINNMINGIAYATRSKVPLLIISGAVHRWQMGKGAMQELNTEDIMKPITKYSKTIMDENEVLIELKKGMEIALTKPYGPVHLSIPIDVQIANFTGDIPDLPSIIEEENYNDQALNKAIELINKEEKGVILVGRGCKGLTIDIKTLSKRLNWPIVTTPEGKGVISTDFELNLGNYGFSTTDTAQEYIDAGDASCVLVMGTSLGESATRNYNDILVKNRKIIHIDWDKRELNKVFKTDIPVYYDLKKALPKLVSNVNKKNNNYSRPGSLNKAYEKNHTGLSTRLFLEKIVEVVPENSYFISDIGEFMNFVFKYLPIKEGMDFEIGLNYGAMGIGVGGAVGLSLGAPDKIPVVIVGDHSFYMNGNEILTAKYYNLPIIYIVINNAMAGYVEHGHSYLYGRSLEGFIQDRVSFVELVKALGIKSIQINELEDMPNIKEFTKDLNGPCVIEVITDGSEPAPIVDRFKSLSNEDKKETVLIGK